MGNGQSQEEKDRDEARRRAEKERQARQRAEEARDAARQKAEEEKAQRDSAERSRDAARRQADAEKAQRDSAARERDRIQQEADRVKRELQAVKDAEARRLEIERKKKAAADWRPPPKWTEGYFDALKDSVAEMKPDVEGLSTFNVLMVGQVGAGKSSMFNTIATAFRGRTVNRAIVGSAEGSLTTVYRMYNFKNINGLRICDTMGLEANRRLDPSVMNAMLDGCVRDKTELTGAMGLKQEPVWQDKIHCVCVMVDGASLDVVDEESINLWHQLQKVIIKHQIPQVAILTKVDLISEDVKNNLQRLFKDEDVENAVSKVAEHLRIPKGRVFPIKNYEEETERNLYMDILAIYTIKKVMETCEDYLEDFGDN